MVAAKALVLLSTLSTSVLAAEASRPRGVGPEFAKFYKSTDKFTCLSNPSITIEVSKINDDYCDCPDGSDEPGTAACTYLSELSPPQPLSGTTAAGPGAYNTTVALPGYYCKNKGHIPGYVPFTYVNDGVCDYELCCDGSDEWEGVGGIKCEDKCKEIGKEWRRLDEIKTRNAMKAAKRREELVKEAQALRAGIEMSISRVQLEIKTLEGKEEELKKKYEEVERKERGRVVKGEGKISKAAILAVMAKNRVEELRESVLSLVQKRSALKKKVEELEAILSTFKEEYNPNFNDEGVKRAVKAWEDYAAKKDADGQDNAAEERDLEDIAKAENDGIEWEDWEKAEEESDVEALYKFEEYLPVSIREWVHQKLTDLRILLVENGILADNANSGSESKAVIDARTAYQSVSDDLGIKQKTLGDSQSDLEKDYGPDDVFRALKGTCVSKDSGEYDYELCWLEKTSQKSKKGGGNTGMGNFVRFGRMEVDEEVGADGKGLGKGERMTLVFENGQHCWNGPSRATTVVLACAEQDEIWKVVEQEKCIYRMDVGTPAACEKVEKKGQGEKKDEL
ncbi:hypothetical protein ACMFMG_000920 [Clarireedia jacksonii]